MIVLRMLKQHVLHEVAGELFLLVGIIIIIVILQWDWVYNLAYTCNYGYMRLVSVTRVS